MPTMGKLMALALLCTTALVLFQPVLMGRLWQIKEYSEHDADLRQAAE
jgi:hypothetical protein